MPALSVMIKPASGACNLRCRYCFYADEMSLREAPTLGVMSDATIENVIEKSLAAAERVCSFAFQGGEPTLAGLDFFRRVVELQKKHNTRKVEIHNALQTNGMVIDDEWAAFLGENKFLVGLSLDGPKDIHDCYRVGVGGAGSYKTVMHAAQLFAKHKVDFNILTVVTKFSAKKIGSIYGFLRRNGFDYQQYITCLAPLEDEAVSVDASPSPDELGDYLCRLFDAWYADAKRGDLVYVRLFANILDMLRGAPPESCNMCGHCNNQYVVESDGSVYPCDFYVLDEWKLGNLNTDSFANLDARRRELGFIEQSLPVPDECKTCEFGYLCRNGCRRERAENPDGSAGKNIYCAGWKKFYAYALPRFKELMWG